MCQDFHEGTLDITSISEGYITLIPKTSSPETANDYRPITLLNYCLKIVTKILANRLQKVILKIIHRNQYGFIKGEPSKTVLHGRLNISTNARGRRVRLFCSSWTSPKLSTP